MNRTFECISLQDIDRIPCNTSNHWIGNVRPTDYETKIEETNTRNWIDRFDIPYTTFTLTNPQHIQWMKEATLVCHITKTFSPLFQEELEETLSELEHIMEETTKSILKQGVFVRTEQVSLKSGCHGVGPYYNMKSILESIVTSRIGHSPMDQNTHSITLYLIPWVDIQHEFRVFVYQNKVTAISQQHFYQEIYHHDDEVRPWIDMILQEFVTIQPKLSFLENYVFDIGIVSGRPYFIEPNTFGKAYTSGSSLFHWIIDQDILYQIHDHVTIRYSRG